MTIVVISFSTSKRSAPEFKTSVVNVQLRNTMMLFRRICNHPYLIEYPLDDAGQYKVGEELITACGKMMLLDKMLALLKKEGHKARDCSRIKLSLKFVAGSLFTSAQVSQGCDAQTSSRLWSVH
jgi:hypothetical protein